MHKAGKINAHVNVNVNCKIVGAGDLPFCFGSSLEAVVKRADISRSWRDMEKENSMRPRCRSGGRAMTGALVPCSILGL